MKECNHELNLIDEEWMYEGVSATAKCQKCGLKFRGILIRDDDLSNPPASAQEEPGVPGGGVDSVSDIASGSSNSSELRYGCKEVKNDRN
jgi:hypothetical protein